MSISGPVSGHSRATDHSKSTPIDSPYNPSTPHPGTHRGGASTLKIDDADNDVSKVSCLINAYIVYSCFPNQPFPPRSFHLISPQNDNLSTFHLFFGLKLACNKRGEKWRQFPPSRPSILVRSTKPTSWPLAGLDQLFD